MNNPAIVVISSILGVGMALAPMQELAPTSKPAEPPGKNEAKPAPSASHPYKVIYWFDGKTWKSQPYDVARGEFTKEVEQWITQTEFDAFGFARPGKMAILRNIELEDGPAETRKERLATAISLEFQRIQRNPSVARHSTAAVPPVRASKPATSPQPLSGPRRSPGASGTDPSMVPSGSPFPSPYPRPHP